MGPEEPLPPALGICGPGARGSQQALGAMTVMTVTAAAAHAQAGPLVSSDEPEPAGSRSAGGGGCGTAGGDTARAQRGHGTQPWARHRACAHAQYTHLYVWHTPLTHTTQSCVWRITLSHLCTHTCARNCLSHGTHTMHVPPQTLPALHPHTAGSHVMAPTPYTHFTHSQQAAM